MIVPIGPEAFAGSCLSFAKIIGMMRPLIIEEIIVNVMASHKTIESFMFV